MADLPSELVAALAEACTHRLTGETQPCTACWLRAEQGLRNAAAAGYAVVVAPEGVTVEHAARLRLNGNDAWGNLLYAIEPAPKES